MRSRKHVLRMAHNASQTRKKSWLSWLSCGVFLFGVLAGIATTTYGLWLVIA